MVHPRFSETCSNPELRLRNGRTTNGNDNKPYPSAEQISAHKQHPSGAFLPRERNFSWLHRSCATTASRKREVILHVPRARRFRSLALSSEGSSSFQPVDAAIKSLLARKPSAPTVSWLSFLRFLPMKSVVKSRLSDCSNSYEFHLGFRVTFILKLVYSRCRV